MSALAPVISSLKRSCMGWLKLNSTSGMVSSEAFIFSTSSARDEALVHSSKGFMTIITSASSTAMGSVGTSAVPILATTCFISGKLSIRIFSARSETLMLRVSELPAGRVICMAKSPSSSVGMNSAPRRVKSMRLAAKAATAATTVAQLNRRHTARHFWYILLSHAKNRSANDGFELMWCERKSDDIIGT